MRMFRWVKLMGTWYVAMYYINEPRIFIIPGQEIAFALEVLDEIGPIIEPYFV